MNFASLSFLGLFLVVLAGRLVLGRQKKEPAYFFLLLVASLVFYAWHIPAYLVLLLGVSGLCFYSANRLTADSAIRSRRCWLLVSLVGALGTLAVFKYTGFVLRLVDQIWGLFGAGSLGFSIEIALPIGISFYTFQALSYVIDVSRRQIEPRRAFREFLLYVSFFPQLVAGPIVRAKDFFYQWNRRRGLRWVSFSEGIFQMIAGFFLKLVVADGLGDLVDRYWGDRSLVTGFFGIGCLTLFFGMQIFADFAGYSMIARGLAYLLGFRLPLNFDAPYLSGSLQEFWRRWHISLSSWLRDYLYIPLGGNRGGRMTTMRNVFLVMVLGGLWHGAGVGFVLWGVVHGLGLLLEKALGIGTQKGTSVWNRILWFLMTQSFVFLAWMFFRMESGSQLLEMLRALVVGGWGVESLEHLVWGGLYVIPILGLHLRRFGELKGLLSQPSILEKAIWAGVMLALTLAAYAQSTAFIYFQF